MFSSKDFIEVHIKRFSPRTIQFVLGDHLMGKDSTNNILFALGAFGSLILVMINAYMLYAMLLSLYLSEIIRWTIVLGSILVAIGILALYRETGIKFLLIAVILYLVMEILVIMNLLGVLYEILLTFLDYNTANLMLNWIFWIFYLIIYMIVGYAIWTTRDEIGIIAAPTGLLLMIWGIINLVLQYLGYGISPSIWDQIWLTGLVIVWLFAFIYFLMEMRS